MRRVISVFAFLFAGVISLASPGEAGSPRAKVACSDGSRAAAPNVRPSLPSGAVRNLKRRQTDALFRASDAAPALEADTVEADTVEADTVRANVVRDATLRADTAQVGVAQVGSAKVNNAKNDSARADSVGAGRASEATGRERSLLDRIMRYLRRNKEDGSYWGFKRRHSTSLRRRALKPSD